MRVRIACCLLVLGVLLATTFAQKPTTKPATKPTKPPPTPDKLMCKVFNTTVKLTAQAYSDSLSAYASADFISLRQEIEAGVMQVYENEKNFVGVSVMKYEKAADGKTNAVFVLEFSTNSTHLAALLKQIATKKLGKLDVDGKFVSYACYTPPPPPVCSLPCPSICAPSCGQSCCDQYAYPQPVYASPPPLPPPPPPPQPIMLPAPPPSCAPTCAPACAPACSRMCCSNTNFYGKRHQTHPEEKESKKEEKMSEN